MPDPTSTADAHRPLTIVMGCDTFAPDVNGAARFTERLCAGLVRHGHDVHVVAPASSHWRVGTGIEVIEGESMTVHRLRSWRWYPHDWLRWIEPWRIRGFSRRILDEVQPDVIHFQSHIIAGEGLSWEGRKRGIRLIGTNHVMVENMLDHTMLPGPLNRVLARVVWSLAHLVLARAEVVTTPTPNAAALLEAATALRGVIPISCGIEASNYRADLAPRTENRAIFVGRLTAEKQLEVLLRALTRLDDLDVRLDIVGGGDQAKALEALTLELGLADRVTFLGRVDDAELGEHLTRAGVFVMPSIAELQSIATLEAMASGLPIVAANAMALPHLVQDGVNGYLFPPGDDEALADRLRKIFEADADTVLAMREASLRGVIPHDIEHTIETFEALYRGEAVDR